MSDLQEALAWVRINCREEATTRLRSRRVAKALADEIERLTAELSKWHETSAEELNFWKKEAESLKSERDALKKDAERYRWLRKNRYMSKYPNSEFDHAMHLSFTVSGVWVNNADPDVLDACIDTAMEESK